MSLVEIKNLTRRFDDVEAVSQVSLAFDKGMIYGFIGPNGAGKTTTMRILATLDVPTSGDAWVAGHSVIQYPDKVRGRIGYMPDYYGTYAHTDIIDYLEFFGRSYELRGKELRRRIDGVIDFTGLGKIGGKYIDTLSKGMKQRLALARLLLHDPDVLILDEPAAGLDPRARIEFRELLKLLKDEGKAVLISSHILTELSEMVDSCAIIEKGRIVCHGSVDEVRERARHEAGSQFKVTIELLEPLEKAESCLLECPFVRRVFGGERHFTVEIEGSRREAASLLQRLVADGMPILNYRVVESDLEDVFMSLTKGEVQ